MAKLNISELDFDAVKTQFKQYLQSQTQFKDYNFEGSNMSVLLDVLAYNTYQNNFYTNMAVNEMFLDSAVLRNSIVSHAKELNYLPRSRGRQRPLLKLQLQMKILKVSQLQFLNTHLSQQFIMAKILSSLQTKHMLPRKLRHKHSLLKTLKSLKVKC